MISIVIPIYNEEETLPELWRRLHNVISSWSHKTEVIFVNDGSSDSSLSILRELGLRNPGVLKIVQLSRNFGHQPAVVSGISTATGDAVILMDGDLQDTPESLPNLVAKWESGYDVVYAIRAKRKEFFLKRLAFKAFYQVQAKMVDLSIPLDAGLFSILDRKVIDIMMSMKEHNRYIPGLRSYAGFKQTGIIVERAERYKGEPRVSTRRLIKLALDGIFSMSHLPLKLATYVGILIAIPAFIVAAVVVGIKLFTDFASPGWASNLASTFFMGGVQLIFLGIIGEYLSRIYDEVKGRPYFIISEKIGFENPDTVKADSEND
ncbi:glycosyltransferase family 2 protein [bacterium]|nr:glycosyltransferase family 2 protein [bacterium]